MKRNRNLPWSNQSYEGGTARLYNQDAAAFLESLEPGTVDLLITSPPYCIGKEYESTASVTDFLEAHRVLLPLAFRALSKSGNLCWQVGNHVKNNKVIPLDALVYSLASEIDGAALRNRIVWTFGHGAHSARRFSGRHETIMWFTKSDDYHFELDAVRVPQRYPGKRHYKGPRKGEWSGNPLGKNPTDVWDIPNVKSKHVEKTAHPCQFPVALVQRLVKSLCREGGVVADPFVGSGSSGVAAILEKRSFLGCDIEERYLEIAKGRFTQAISGTARYRADQPTKLPKGKEAVATAPPHFFLKVG